MLVCKKLSSSSLAGRGMRMMTCARKSHGISSTSGAIRDMFGDAMDGDIAETHPS